MKHQISNHSYVDDTQLYVYYDNEETLNKLAIKRLEHCIVDVCNWLKSNALKLNKEKNNIQKQLEKRAKQHGGRVFNHCS